MNTFTKLLFTATIISSSYSFAQENYINFSNIPSSINNNYSFDGAWKITNASSNKSFIINGNKLTNNSKKSSKTLFLDLYFVPTNSTVDLNNLPNRVKTDVVLDKLEAGTSLNDVSISFNDDQIKDFQNGEYTPIILLREKQNNKINNYKILNNKISITPESIYIDKPQFEQTNNEIAKLDSVAIYNPKLFEDYTTVESSIDLDSANKKINFEGVWKLDIDFESLLININGENNKIINSDPKPTSDLKLLVYFSKENINNSKLVNGYELINIDLPKLTGYSAIENPTFETNITKLLPAGEYYPTLAIVEKGDKGQYIIKSTIALGEKYTWQ